MEVKGLKDGVPIAAETMGTGDTDGSITLASDLIYTLRKSHVDVNARHR